jgi:hypothetical protein
VGRAHVYKRKYKILEVKLQKEVVRGKKYFTDKETVSVKGNNTQTRHWTEGSGQLAAPAAKFQEKE